MDQRTKRLLLCGGRVVVGKEGTFTTEEQRRALRHWIGRIARD